MRRVAVLGSLVLLLAGAADAAAKTGSVKAAGRPCDRVDVFRYELTVTGAKSGRETWLPQSATTGEFSFSYEYVVRYPALRVVVDRGCGPELTSVRARGPGTGTLRSYAWADHAVPKDQSTGTEVPCDIQASSTGLRASVRIAGGTAVRGGSPATFGVLSELRESALFALSAQLEGLRAAACDKGELPNLPLLEEFAAHLSVPLFENRARVGNLKVDPPSLAFGGTLVGRVSRTPRALARLTAGRSARVATGVRSYHAANDETDATGTTAVTLRFERRR